MRAGVPPTTLYDWLERGRAHPHEEPYGSFAVDYLRAERGLDQAGATATALRVQALLEAQQALADWQESPGPPPVRPERPKGESVTESDWQDYDLALGLWELAVLGWKTPPKVPPVQDFEWLSRAMERRYPEDYGTHPHRKPETDPSGDSWLERNGITHGQLVHMLKEPPESIARALVEAGDDVYRLLVAAGWHVPA